MAKRGTQKALSVDHETYVATMYRGRRSKTSGASPTDLGDVRPHDEQTLFECKGKFGERCGEKPVRATLVKQMEKIADEAWQAGREPAIALRFWMPESPLSDLFGWVDLSVRLLSDDASRSEQLKEQRGD